MDFALPSFLLPNSNSFSLSTNSRNSERIFYNIMEPLDDGVALCIWIVTWASGCGASSKTRAREFEEYERAVSTPSINTQ